MVLSVCDNSTGFARLTAATGVGHAVERYVYDPPPPPEAEVPPEGRVSIFSGTGDARTRTWAQSRKNEILFAGYRYNPETGAYQVRHREYHPTVGRFMQRDPLGYVDGGNLYEYVGSSPVRYLDYSGNWRIEGSTAIAVRGDTAWGLARSMTGDSSRYTELRLPSGRKRWEDIRPGDRVDVSKFQPRVAATPAAASSSGTWSYRSSEDIWKIQTVLKNNQSRFGLPQVQINGNYDEQTKQAVCAFQKVLVNAGHRLPQKGPDGKWGIETSRAFEAAESTGAVNWRYAHVWLGGIPVTFKWHLNVSGFSLADYRGDGSGKLFRLVSLDQAVVERHISVSRTTKSGGSAGFGFGGSSVLIAYGPFNERIWQSSDSSTGVSIPLAASNSVSKLEKLAGTINDVSSIVNNLDALRRVWTAADDALNGDIWRGHSKVHELPLPGGASFEAYSGSTVSLIHIPE